MTAYKNPDQTQDQTIARIMRDFATAARPNLWDYCKTIGRIAGIPLVAYALLSDTQLSRDMSPDQMLLFKGGLTALWLSMIQQGGWAISEKVDTAIETANRRLGKIGIVKVLQKQTALADSPLTLGGVLKAGFITAIKGYRYLFTPPQAQIHSAYSLDWRGSQILCRHIRIDATIH